MHQTLVSITSRRAFRAVAALAALLLLAAAAVAAQPAPAAPPAAAAEEESRPAPGVTLERVTVTPTRPGREALCTLSVALQNRGDKTASAFAFSVEVAGVALPVYRDQVFLQGVPAGETVDLRLFNFWSSETGRPAPPKGDLPVTVTLREAQWMTVADEDGVEVWTPIGAVPGLPVTQSVAVPLD